MQNTFTCNFKLKLNLMNIKYTLPSENSVNINIFYYYITIKLN